MLPKIAVLLDGSPLAEKALAYALRLTSLSQARLLLVGTRSHSRHFSFLSLSEQNDPPKLESIENYIQDVQENYWEAGPVRAVYPQVFTLDQPDTAPELQDYLTGLRDLLTKPGARSSRLEADRIETIQMFGSPRHILEELAEDQGIELVVMAVPTLAAHSKYIRQITHLYRFFGHAVLPLLLVPTDPAALQESLEQSLAKPTALSYMTNRHRVAVMLDGSDAAETVLPAAIKVAARLNAAVYLLRVIVPAVGATDLETAAAQEQAYLYLNQLQEKLNPGLPKNVWLIKTVRVNQDLAAGVKSFIEVAQPGIVAAATPPLHGLEWLPFNIGKSSLSPLLLVVSQINPARPALLVTNAANSPAELVVPLPSDQLATSLAQPQPAEDQLSLVSNVWPTPVSSNLSERT